jgi:hypothetical protein
VANTATSGSYDYSILLKVEGTGSDAGKLLSSDSVRVQNVCAGQTRNVTSRSFRPMREAATFSCTLSRASKYPAS